MQEKVLYALHHSGRDEPYLSYPHPMLPELGSMWSEMRENSI